jgi:hypothetical protein
MAAFFALAAYVQVSGAGGERDPRPGGGADSPAEGRRGSGEVSGEDKR